MDFSAEHRRYGDRTIVALGGDIDVSTSGRLRETLLGLVEDGARHLVVEMDRVTFLDSTGLGVLVGVFHRLRALGGTLVFAGGTSRVRDVFHVTQLTKIFLMFPSVDEALRAEPTAAGD
ncbi:STAS domain-containing protein [Actinomadura kijaniata]|uniref:STAS domain-containing protein n=1 Tax=Actinomadura kijaniata TaxID=46161 RepID=UPI003F1B1B2F